MSAPIRLLLADPYPLLRTGFRMVLGGQPDLVVVGEAGGWADTLDLARRLAPDVVLLDLGLPRPDGETAVRALTGARPAPRVLLLAGGPDATGPDAGAELAAGVPALRAGAHGLLARGAPAPQLLAAIRAVAAGDAVLPAGVLRHLLGAPPPVPPPAPTPEPAADPLTDREREVLLLVARGLSNGEIATRLGVGEATVKTHIGRLLAKLELRDRVQAVVYAYETGLVRPGG